MNDLYCKLYLANFAELDVLRSTLEELIGAQESVRTFRGKSILADLFDNSRAHQEAADKEAFVTWPAYLEIDAPDDPSVDADMFVNDVRRLLIGLAEQGVRAVPACDFEPRLEGAGRR